MVISIYLGTSLVVQCLRLVHASKARGPGLIPGRGTRSYLPQLKILQTPGKIKDPVCRN